MIRHLLFCAFLYIVPLTLFAAEPVVKSAVVAPDSMYEDVVNIPFDDKGVDITVHFTFDEFANTLTLAISGTRKLFVFERDTYTKQAFRGKWFSRKRLYPEKLRYPVLIQPKTKYYLARQVRKGYKRPRRKHLFNRWLEYSKEVQTIVPKEFPLVIDSIVQKFTVHPQATKASITMRNILVVDPDGGLALDTPIRVNTNKSVKYEFVHDQDMALTYNVTLRRNPCFGMEARTDSMNNAANEVAEAYKRLVNTSPEGVATSRAEMDVFNQHKQYLLSQYQHIDQTSECPDVMKNIQRYNLYVDSIAAAVCVYQEPEAVAETDAAKMLTKAKRKLGVNPQMLLRAAHNLDDTAARIINSSDPVQQHDLVESGKEIISNISVTLQQRDVLTAEQKAALAVYRRAERYFRNLIKQ